MPTFTAKDIVVKPIDRKDADRIVKTYHYSGKVVNNSQLHIGVFLGGKLEGAMQFGPSLDKRKIVGLVEGTGWNEFIELNRMAFSDRLPRNSESRALAITFRMMRQFAPHIKWVISFADGTQSGDGAIYRACGFVLTAINGNVEMVRMPNGEVVHRVNFCDKNSLEAQRFANSLGGKSAGMTKILAVTGGKRMNGFQLRYIYFLDPTYRARLTVPILPFDEIDRRGAGMYKGQQVSRATSADSGTPGDQPGGSGATPTVALNEVTHGA